MSADEELGLAERGESKESSNDGAKIPHGAVVLRDCRFPVLPTFTNSLIFYRLLKGRVEVVRVVHNENEADKGLSNERGTIAMARTSDPHSATDQFFINLVTNLMLDHRNKSSDAAWGYTAFGRVIDGMNIVSRIGLVKTGAGGPFPTDVPQEPVVIEKATIIQ